MEDQEKTTGSSPSTRAHNYLRTNFDRALAMCQSRNIDVLICTRLNRLPPDRDELRELEARCEAAGVRIEILDTQPLRLRLYKTPDRNPQNAASQPRTSRRRKNSHRRKGSTLAGRQANLPLFEE